MVQAALATGGTIVTFNLDDFPAETLRPLGVEAVTPDVAPIRAEENDADGVLEAARAIRGRLKSPRSAPQISQAGSNERVARTLLHSSMRIWQSSELDRDSGDLVCFLRRTTGPKALSKVWRRPSVAQMREL